MPMTFMTKLGLSAALLVILSGAFWFWKRSYDNARRLEGKIEILAQDLTRRDSILTSFLTQLGARLDNQILTATNTIERWRTVTQTVTLPGRVDSVFKDSAFAALPDSVKVKVLTQLGTQVANQCSEALNSCQIYKDSTQRQFAIKDSLLAIANLRFETKTRRPCGIGGTLGPSAGIMRFPGDTAQAWRPAWGFAGTVGFTCSF